MELLLNNEGLSWLAANICRHLKLEDLSKCRCVSKSFKSVIDSDVHWWRQQIQTVIDQLKKIKLVNKKKRWFHLLKNPNQWSPLAPGKEHKQWKKATLFEFYPDLVIVLEQALQQNFVTTKRLVDHFKEYLLAMRNPNSIHTPEHPTLLAVRMRNSEFLKWLQSNGASSMNCVDSTMRFVTDRGPTALELAASIGYSDGVEILLKSLSRKHSRFQTTIDLGKKLQFKNC